MIFFIAESFKSILPEVNDRFDYLLSLSGKVYRQLEGRETLRFEINKQGYFIKKHFGVGWREIIKNLLQGRLPVISARNEWEAARQLAKQGVLVPEILAYGKRGYNPARCESFVVMKEVADSISLEDLSLQWRQQPPAATLKWQLIEQVARITRTMHQTGINHRDCYICHFLLPKSDVNTQHPRLYLIDLHRAQQRSRVPHRWLIKDLAGLYFSSLAIGLTRRDLLRFLHHYFKLSWRDLRRTHLSKLQSVERKAHAIYEKEYGCQAPMKKLLI